VKLPRPVQREQLYLTHAQVHAMAENSGDYRLVVLVLAYLGLRWGEMAALRVGRIDFLRRRLVVAESVTLVDGVQTWGAPKSYEHREVPIPRFLADELASHVAGKNADDLVFTGVRGGGALRVPTFRRAAFDRAAAEVGMPGLRPHDLRHTAASLAIASGATVKVVQRMLGHASATVTLDRYGHLYSNDLDDLADRMHAAAEAVRGNSADFLRTSGELILLPKSAGSRGSPVVAGL
jgi:integrase